MTTLPKYALITPARNEARFIELTLKSVVAQTVRPVKWVIVSDGSTDGTDEIVGKYAAANPWIKLVRQPVRTERSFAGKAVAFSAGYAELSEEGTDIKDPSDNIEHVSGACQMFRRECFEAIGGYSQIKSGGIDLIAVFSARAKGWQTRRFPEKFCWHHRKMGEAHYTGFRERIHRGRMDYILGSHPLWEIFRSVYQIRNRPYVIGGFLIFFGYVWTWFRRVERTMPADLVRLRQDEQMRRLKNILRRSLHLGSRLGDEVRA